MVSDTTMRSQWRISKSAELRSTRATAMSSDRGDHETSEEMSKTIEYGEEQRWSTTVEHTKRSQRKSIPIGLHVEHRIAAERERMESKESQLTIRKCRTGKEAHWQRVQISLNLFWMVHSGRLFQFEKHLHTRTLSLNYFCTKGISTTAGSYDASYGGREREGD